ncbi:MAG TPA: chalcone isomerase family protein [Paucimonas sp.]|nr:chalcone isomerase family protein [Paucimonas sp.]
MKRLAHAFRSLMVVVLVTALPAFAAVDVGGGVKFDDTARVANHELKLNGAGIRHKVIFKVYAAGLYLQDKKTTVPDVLALQGPKRVSIVMMRDLSSEEFGRAFLTAINQNIDKAEKAKLVNQLLKFGELFASVPELKKGDVLTTDWVPNTGTIMQINGKKMGEPFPDVAFYNALLKIWLGDKPVDATLKRALLGEKTEEGRKNEN